MSLVGSTVSVITRGVPVSIDYDDQFAITRHVNSVRAAYSSVIRPGNRVSELNGTIFENGYEGLSLSFR